MPETIEQPVHEAVYQELKWKVHRLVMSRLHLQVLGRLPVETARERVKQVIDEVLHERNNVSRVHSRRA